MCDSCVIVWTYLNITFRTCAIEPSILPPASQQLCPFCPHCRPDTQALTSLFPSVRNEVTAALSLRVMESNMKDARNLDRLAGSSVNAGGSQFLRVDISAACHLYVGCMSVVHWLLVSCTSAACQLYIIYTYCGSQFQRVACQSVGHPPPHTLFIHSTPVCARILECLSGCRRRHHGPLADELQYLEGKDYPEQVAGNKGRKNNGGQPCSYPNHRLRPLRVPLKGSNTGSP